MSLLNQLTQLGIKLLWPEFCCCCNKRGSLLCDDCYERLNFLTLPVQLKLEEIYLDKVVAALQYDHRSKKLITTLKYGSVIEVGRVLGELLYFSTNIPKAEIITAVPLHPTKKRSRGFNQAEEIAKTLAAQMNLPYKRLLKRTVDTPSQAGRQSRKQRLTALTTAFAPTAAKTKVSGKSILIIDDVVTTGTTLNECAKVLKKSDVYKVYGLAVASR